MLHAAAITNTMSFWVLLAELSLLRTACFTDSPSTVLAVPDWELTHDSCCKGNHTEFTSLLVLLTLRFHLLDVMLHLKCVFSRLSVV